MMKRLLLMAAVLGLAVFAFPDRGYGAVLQLPLYSLAPAKTVDLKCTSAEHTLQLPIPQRWSINRVLLNFSYVNSSGLLPGKSRLMVKLNNYPVSQIDLNPLAPEGVVKLQIPNYLFEAGYNELSFSVSQHYAMECEQACAADLWTTLKLDQAFLDFDYELKPVPLKLSAVNDFLFDPKISPRGEVNLVLEDTSAELLSIAGIVASGIARHFDYRKVLFTTSRRPVPGMDNVLIGARDFLKSFPRLQGLEVRGPLLKIQALPAAEHPGGIDPAHALLLVTGVDRDQLKLAAETLAVLSPPFPNTDELLATEFRMPEIPMYGGKLVVTPEKKYTFKTLNFDSYTFHGINPAARELNFRLPADLLIKPNVYVDIALYFAYGAAMRQDSTLNLQLNGQHVRAIHLNNSNGDLIEGYNIRIPTYMFKPGDNTIRFEAVLTPSHAVNCENIQTENLFLTVFDNSTVIFPQMPHFAELPNLSLFMLNGYPLTRWPDGNGTRLLLAGKDENTINAALNLLGVVTQKNGYPLFEVAFTYDDPGAFDGELTIVGAIPSLPERYRGGAPLQLTRETTVPYPVMRSWSDEKAFAFSKQISGFQPGQGVLMEFLSPLTEGRTVLLLTAATSADLVRMSEALTEPVVQSQVAGDLVFVDFSGSENQVRSLSVGEKYIAGKTGNISTLDRYLYFYPWLYYLLIVVVAIGLSLMIFVLLRRVRARRHKGHSSSHGH